MIPAIILLSLFMIVRGLYTADNFLAFMGSIVIVGMSLTYVMAYATEIIQ